MFSLQRKFPRISTDFIKSLTEAAGDSKSQLMNNPSTSHAEAALIFLYAKAKKRVSIFEDLIKNSEASTSLEFQKKWENLVLSKNIRLEVVTRLPNDNSYCLALLRNFLGNKYCNYMYRPNEKGLAEIQLETKGNKPFHFTVVDKKAYRLEFDTVNHKAYLNFNDTSMSSRLDGYFKRVKGENPFPSEAKTYSNEIS